MSVLLVEMEEDVHE